MGTSQYASEVEEEAVAGSGTKLMQQHYAADYNMQIAMSEGPLFMQCMVLSWPVTLSIGLPGNIDLMMKEAILNLELWVTTRRDERKVVKGGRQALMVTLQYNKYHTNNTYLRLP